MKPENLKKLKQVYIYYEITILAGVLLAFYVCIQLQKLMVVPFIMAFSMVLLCIGINISKIIKSEQD